MVKGFSAREIEIMLQLPQQMNMISLRMRQCVRCEVKYKKLVSSLDIASIPASLKSIYIRWITP